jgi:integrase
MKGVEIMASIFKRGKKWSYNVFIGRDPITGKRKQKSKSGFNTKKEAEIAAAKIESEIYDGNYVEVTKATFDAVAQEYFKTVAKNKLRESTYQNRLDNYNKRIEPVLGKRKIKDITPAQIQTIYSDWADEGLSSSYTRTMHNFIASVFKYAYRVDYIKRNPIEKVDAPIPKSKDLEVWDSDEIKKFLKVAKDYDTFIIYFLAIYTGMRKGEILGLRWKDVDFKNNKIHVTQTLVKVNEELKFQEPKTKGSKRQIALTSAEMLELKKHRLTKTIKSETDLVVTTSVGTPYSPRNLLRNFYMIIDKTGVKKISFRDLRHTHATLLLKLGVNPKIVSERLGHSKVSITLDIYSHVLPDMQESSAQQLSDHLNGKAKKKV